MTPNRIARSLFATMLALVLCPGCATQGTASQTTQQDDAPTEATGATGFAAPTEAEGYDILGGTWEVAAVTIEDKIVPVDAVESLADLYDSVFLGFSKDGTFEYRNNVFITRGQYTPYEDKEGVFVLRAQTTSRATVEDGKITETEGESSDKAYLVVTREDLENALGFVEIDPTTGKIKKSDSTKYFRKRGEKSAFDSDRSGSSSSDTSANESTSDDGGGPSNSSPSNSGPSSTSYQSGNQRAAERARQYLQTQPFSRNGLVEQLEYEGFSHEDAAYGADASGADWDEQAVLKAKQYLTTTAFSESGLIEQLVYEGYTQEQAQHGVSLCGANWMEQAVKKARQYQSLSPMSYSRRVEQLEYEGFTHQQAVYGADNA